MVLSGSLTRRSFIRKSAATGAFVAAPQIVPSSVLGREGHTAPSERINVGFIGIGQHGFDWNLPPYLAAQGRAGRRRV